MSISSQDPIITGKLVALFSSPNRLNQETLPDREDFPLRHQQVFESNEAFFIFSILMVVEITRLLKRDLNS